MKKLMILGAIAATAVGYGAEASYLAQVYDVSITMKTGVCKAGKATAATVKYYEAYLGKGNAPVAKGDEMGFRKQATRKITGVIWGCDCETIAFPAWRVYRANGNNWNLGGYAFWDQTANTYFVLPSTRFAWNCLNRINADFKTVEGAWQLANSFPRQTMRLTGAGFGKASIAAFPHPCRSIISNISGSFAGFRLPFLDDLVSDCPYCGVGSCNVRPFCEWCTFWTGRRFLTAAYGSWSIKFNKSAATKLARTMRITESFTFKKAGTLPTVLNRMESAVQLLAQRGWLGWDGTVPGAGVNTWLFNQNDRRWVTRLLPGQVWLTYLSALNPGAVTINNAAIIINWGLVTNLGPDDDDDYEEVDNLEITDAADFEDADTIKMMEAAALYGNPTVDPEEEFAAYVTELVEDDPNPVVYYDEEGEVIGCKACGSAVNGADPVDSDTEDLVAEWAKALYNEISAFVDAS